MIVKQKNQKFKLDILTYHFRQFNLSATGQTSGECLSQAVGKIFDSIGVPTTEIIVSKVNRMIIVKVNFLT